MGYAIVGGIILLVILCAVAFARFLEWKDRRDMARADSEIHWVRHGVFDSSTTKVQW